MAEAISLKLLLLILSCPLNILVFGFELMPSKCDNFTDIRANPLIDSVKRAVLAIPSYLTNGKDKELQFFLENKWISAAARYLEECKNAEILEIPLKSLNTHKKIPQAHEYPFQNQAELINTTFFTFDGYFHQNGQYWHPEDYCFQSISDDYLTIKFCKLNCSADLSNTFLHSQTPRYEPSRICMPKCCGVDETLSLTDGTCRRLNDSEPNYFLPYLHLLKPIWYRDEHKEPHLDKYKVLVNPILSANRKTWNSSHGIVGGSKTIWQYLQFVRNNMHCQNYNWKAIEYNRVNTKCSKGNKYDFRVEVQPGMVKLKFLTKSRKWIEYKQRFCVDGLDGWGQNLSSMPVNQVVVFCVDDKVSTKTGSGIKLKSENSTINPVTYLYLVVVLFCGGLFLVGFLMYGFAWSQLNLNGKIVASYLFTLSASYIFTFLDLTVSLSEFSKNGDNAVQVVNSEFDNWSKRIGWFCVCLAPICHYFYLSRYFWLWAFNAAGWTKLRNVFKDYWAYAVLGWGMPAFMVAILCIFDSAYEDPWSEAVVPDYGVETCNVASWSAGYYVHIPVGLVLMLSFLYILITWVFSFKTYAPRARNDSETILPFKFFICVCFVVTFAWTIMLQEWVRTVKGQEANWARPMLLIFGAMVETLLLFHIFCMNTVVLELISERFKWTKGIVNFFIRRKLVWKGSGLLGLILEEDDSNDTVVIEPNELMALNGSS